MAKPGLWVMEGKWSAKVSDVRSVEPVLAALDEAGRARYVTHHLNDRDDLVRQLNRWGRAQHQRYGIGYIALHGSPMTVHIGRYIVKLEDVAMQIPDGLLRTKMLHFGSCAVLDLEEPVQQALRSQLGVKVLTGFTKDVDWFESLAFELLLFEALSRYKRPSDAERYLRKNFGEFADRLGFVMVR